jgi:hypothetical protein
VVAATFPLVDTWAHGTGLPVLVVVAMTHLVRPRVRETRPRETVAVADRIGPQVCKFVVALRRLGTAMWKWDAGSMQAVLILLLSFLKPGTTLPKDLGAQAALILARVNILLAQLSDPLIEQIHWATYKLHTTVPVSTLKYVKRNWPAGANFYNRLFPGTSPADRLALDRFLA